MNMPTTYSGMHETIPNPYPPSSSMDPRSQQPLGFINVGNQAQSGQIPFITSPGIFASSQQDQGNIQVVTPVIQITTTHFKDEGKTLGAIQIIIGLMHIGFGIILGLLSFSYEQSWGFTSKAFVAGYPFWGGVCFIISGSLCVLASKELSPCLVKGSLGMNIVSSLLALIGAILLLVDIGINGQNDQNYWVVLSGRGISGILAIFSLLDMCLTCATAHFANRTIAYNNKSVLVIPNVYATNPFTQESFPAPPRNDGHPAYSIRY